MSTDQRNQNRRSSNLGDGSTTVEPNVDDQAFLLVAIFVAFQLFVHDCISETRNLLSAVSEPSWGCTAHIIFCQWRIPLLVWVLLLAEGEDQSEMLIILPVFALAVWAFAKVARDPDVHVGSSSIAGSRTKPASRHSLSILRSLDKLAPSFPAILHLLVFIYAVIFGFSNAIGFMICFTCFLVMATAFLLRRKYPEWQRAVEDRDRLYYLMWQQKKSTIYPPRLVPQPHFTVLNTCGWIVAILSMYQRSDLKGVYTVCLVVVLPFQISSLMARLTLLPLLPRRWQRKGSYTLEAWHICTMVLCGTISFPWKSAWKSGPDDYSMTIIGAVNITSFVVFLLSIVALCILLYRAPHCQEAVREREKLWRILAAERGEEETLSMQVV